MFDIGWMELMVVGMVALIVVGPKELPALLRTLGKYFGVVKRQANEFKAQFDDAIRESEFSDIKKEVEEISGLSEESIRDADAQMRKDFEEYDQDFEDDGAEWDDDDDDKEVATVDPKGEADAAAQDPVNGDGGSANDTGESAGEDSGPAPEQPRRVSQQSGPDLPGGSGRDHAASGREPAAASTRKSGA